MPWVYVHSAIYETYLVQWFSIDLCSIGEGVVSVQGYMCILLYMTYSVWWYCIDLWYMCLLRYMKLICYSGVAGIYG